MNRSLRRLPYILLASALAIPAVALAAPPPPPSAPPVPVPYPNTSSRDAASGLPSGKRMHKPYTLTTSAGQEAACTAVNVQPVNIASDPEEGGQVSAARTATKPTVSDISVMKTTDPPSAKLAEATPSDGAAVGSCTPAHN